jgi:hypothetical protein
VYFPCAVTFKLLFKYFLVVAASFYFPPSSKTRTSLPAFLELPLHIEYCQRVTSTSVPFFLPPLRFAFDPRHARADSTSISRSSWGHSDFTSLDQSPRHYGELSSLHSGGSSLFNFFSPQSSHLPQDQRNQKFSKTQVIKS